MYINVANFRKDVYFIIIIIICDVFLSEIMFAETIRKKLYFWGFSLRFDNFSSTSSFLYIICHPNLSRSHSTNNLQKIIFFNTRCKFSLKKFFIVHLLYFRYLLIPFPKYWKAWNWKLFVGHDNFRMEEKYIYCVFHKNKTKNLSNFYCR